MQLAHTSIHLYTATDPCCFLASNIFHPPQLPHSNLSPAPTLHDSKFFIYVLKVHSEALLSQIIHLQVVMGLWLTGMQHQSNIKTESPPHTPSSTPQNTHRATFYILHPQNILPQPWPCTPISGIWCSPHSAPPLYAFLALDALPTFL